MWLAGTTLALFCAIELSFISITLMMIDICTRAFPVESLVTVSFIIIEPKRMYMSRVWTAVLIKRSKSLCHSL